MLLSTAVIITVIAVIFSGLFSGTEIAYVQSDRVRMEIDAARGGLTDRLIQVFVRHEDMFISSLLVGNNAVLVIYGIAVSAILNPVLERWLPNEALVLVCNTVLSTGLILITGEFLPKTVFRINPNLMMRLLALPLFLVYIVLYPVSAAVSWISRCLMRMCGIQGSPVTTGVLTIDQLDDYLQQSLDGKPSMTAVENEVKIFRNAIDFKDTQIGDCMIPRNEMVAVALDGTTRQQLVELFMSTGLSKIVVYREDIDDVVGYIHISEMFSPGTDWRKQLKPVIFTPVTMLAQKMMRRMMAEKRSLVIVIDEFGGTAGLVTLEDLVEEIFGEIEDEHDLKRTLVRRLADGTYEVSGRAEIEHLNEEYGLNIKESEDYHTVGGFILDTLEALPAVGDTFVSGGLRFTVLRMSDTRIELVAVSRVDETEREES